MKILIFNFHWYKNEFITKPTCEYNGKRRGQPIVMTEAMNYMRVILPNDKNTCIQYFDKC